MGCIMLRNFLRIAAVLIAAVPGAVVQAAPDPVVAVVNGTEIHRSAVELLLRTLPQGQGVATDAALQDQILDHLITAEVLREEMRRQELDQAPEVRAQLAEMERHLFRHVYQTRVIEPQITDAVLRAHYDRIIKDLPEREEIRVRHILLGSETEAQSVVADIQRGADFASVARERSFDSSKNRGGDLGFLPIEALVEPFAQAAVALQPGQMSSQPVQSPFGWHVIRLEERRRSKPGFDDVQDEFKASLVQQALTQSLEALRAKAVIKKMSFPAVPRGDRIL
ncbi:MAG: cbf2 [Rhodospirillaceae bacterium]|nr:MAG: cbf2 [Rhodospirillaceae bacterium]